MTSTPVKDVKSLMNFVEGNSSLKKTGGMDQAGSFGDVMSKTKGGLANGQMQAAKSSKTMQVPATNATQSRRDVVSTNTKETTVKETTVREDMTTEQNQQVLEEAGEEIVKEVAEELGVSEEEVTQAMEELGLSAIALLDPSNLTQLVLQLSGEQDQMAFLTDENLFSQLQNLLSKVSDVKNGLMESLDVNPEELQVMLDEMYYSYEELKAGETVTEMQATVSEEPVITVEVKAGDETIKLEADENGNAVKNIEVVSPTTEENVAREKNDGQEQRSNENEKQGMEENLSSSNPMLDALNQNIGTVEVSFDQTVPFFSEQTQDIMDQIMDYMKIQLKPGMDQLEMQLHPESLGTVHIQLTSKGGEITAQFQVQNESVKAALESQVSTLQETLKEQGIKVEAVQVTVESHGFESNLWQGQGREENANASSQNSKKAPRRINLNELDVNDLAEEDAREEDLLAAKMMAANGNTVDYTA